MKKIFLFSFLGTFLIFASFYSVSFAVLGVGDTSVVTDPIHTAINKARAVLATAHEVFTKNQYIIMARTMYDNYMASKRYFDMVQKMSEHPGGFLGYLHNYAAGQVNLVRDEQIKMYTKLKEGSEDSQVDNLLKGYSKKLSDKINKFGDYYDDYQSYGEKMTENAERRNQDILKTFDEANKKMDDQKMKEIQTKLFIHQTQILIDLEAMIRAQQLMDMKKQKDEIQSEKEELVSAMELIKNMGEKTKQLTTGNRKNPYDELRKLPNQR